MPQEDPVDLFGADFAAELQSGMEELLAELGKAPAVPGEDPKEIEEMRKAWEKMMIAGMNASGVDENDPSSLFSAGVNPLASAPSAPTAKSAGPSAAGPSGSSSEAKAEAEFQKTIRQAMEKLKDSEEHLKVRTFDL